MFGMRHFQSRCEERWAAGRGGRGRHGLFGFGGRHGMGGGDMIRAGRMLATGDLRLIALALIADEPRHGYEIIKVLEEKTAGWYSPSPGIVYPTLTYLEEAGYVTAQAEGAKKLYTITDEGRAYLADNRDFVDAVLDRLAAVGRKIAKMRRRFSDDEREEGRRDTSMPRLVKAALENLREVASKRLEEDAEAEAKIVDILARAAADVRRN
jgi:DNA-binding PadR family transcriptional regulator